MFILGVVSAGFVLVAIFLTVLRLIFDRRFTAIQQEPDQTVLFRRKVNYLRKIEQTRHTRYLLLSSLILGLALLLFLSAFLMLVNDHQKMTTQTHQMKEWLTRIEKQQKQLIASLPLKNYPENGIGLKGEAWEKVTAENSKLELKKELETTIAQKTVPYFGSSDTSVSLTLPKTMTLQLNGQMADSASQETIKKNIDAFAKEAEDLPELTEIHVRMVTSVDKNKKVVYSVNYSREKSEDAFNKKNDFEQNLKNDGGKG